MEKIINLNDLTDEQILREFVKRFKCDGAVLVYMDGDHEYWFDRWRTKDGRQWTNNIMRLLNPKKQKIRGPKPADIIKL